MSVLFLLLACRGEAVFLGDTGSTDPFSDSKDSGLGDSGPGDSDSSPGTTEDYSEWDGATLVVNSPASGSFLPLDTETTFSATVYDANGNATDFDDITWVSDVDTDWLLTGREQTDSTLSVGTHAITAVAELPNGDRLAYTMGGILVQSIYAGIYVGELQIDASGEYKEQTYSVGCAGSLTLTVSAEGDVVTGDAGCLLSLFGYDLDTTYGFDMTNTDGALEGEAAIDLVLFDYPVDTTGTISEDGAINGSFSIDVAGFVTIAGTYDATLLTRDLSSVE